MNQENVGRLVRVLGVVGTCAAGMGWGAACRADLIAYEGFDSPIGTQLIGSAGGTGFTSPWYDAITVAAGSGYQVVNGFAGHGGALGFDPSAGPVGGTRARRVPTINTNDQPLYMSFLIRDTGENEALRVNFGFAGAIPSSYNTLCEAQVRATNVYALNGSLTTRVPTTTGMDLVVIVSSSTGIQMFVNPDLSNPVPLISRSGTGVTINAIGLNLNTSAHPGQSFLIDEIRVGTTFDDVVNQVPTPGAGGAILLATGWFGRRRRNAR